MFQPVEGPSNFPAQEETILEFWRKHKIYDKSLAQREGAPEFVFYEGPPTANGKPHPGHCLTRAIKDLFPRYRTMRGDRCERKAGWDTHGLPVEVEVCKEMGIHSKEEIEAFGIEPFIQKCQQSVWRYMKEWEQMTERLGFWIHLEDAYVTYHQSYVESVWWSLKTMFDKGLLYQGHKIVWWWAQGGTALSAGEVGQGYREVADPSVFVKFPLLDDAGKVTDTSLLVWTTTPWTLPSNQFAAVHPELDYATVLDPGDGDGVPAQKLLVAEALVEKLAAKVKREFTIESRCKGADLIGRRYVPPFDFFYKEHGEKEGTLLAGEKSQNKTDKQFTSWRVVAADFVTTESGSGIVHQAPAFGEVDYDVLANEMARFVEGEGPELLNAVAPDGSFTEVTHNENTDGLQLEGRWVKDCDKEITRDMKARGLLFFQEQYLHDYPFCWRASEDPLIQYPRESWFIQTTSVKEKMLANNADINWMPDHIRDGRFGNFLESNVDWALSRERFWGTPLPIWVCEETGYKEAMESYEELLAKPGATGMDVWEKAKAKNPDMPDDLRVHKPYIDAITYDSPKANGARMVRVTEVIDCWYDSGAMPFAQWGWRGEQAGEAADRFFDQFPADFISEAIDQTRGWFYSQLAISTLLFSEDENGEPMHRGIPTFPVPHPFRNCIVLGLMLTEWWENTKTKERFLNEDEAKEKGTGKFTRKIGKMSKSLRNYRAPSEIFDVHGADALRWYLFSAQPPWNSIIYSEQAIKASIPEFMLRLWNVYSFFVLYANIDEFDPAKELSGKIGQLPAGKLSTAKTYRPVPKRCELDRWILSELQTMTADVVELMDNYDSYVACQRVTAFVDALSNWYVRRSRDRFWASDKKSPEKLDAYWTLYECLIATCKVIAPFTPFMAETLWQNLVVANFGDEACESVHLCDYPTGNTGQTDAELSSRMALIREIASLGRAARGNAEDAVRRVRQPLAKVEVVLADSTHLSWLQEQTRLIENELNVKEVAFTTEGDEYIAYSIVPNFKLLGPRLGKHIPFVKKLLCEKDGAELLAEMKSNGTIAIELPDGAMFQLNEEDIEVRLTAKEGWTAAGGKGCVVVLSTELTEELLQEGIARDVVRAIQDQRKELGCDYTDRIKIAIVTSDEKFSAAISANEDYIKQETLGDALLCIKESGCLELISPVEVIVSKMTMQLSIQVIA